MTLRDQLAEAALAGLMAPASLRKRGDKFQDTLAYAVADAVLKRHEPPPPPPPPSEAELRQRRWESHGHAKWGFGVAEDIERLGKYNRVVMSWISESTSLLISLVEREGMPEGAKKIIAESCRQCWEELGNG